jgi:hypothetical protein
MAVYQITAPDGAVYRITGPENARQEDLIRAIQQQTQQAQYAKMQAEIDELRKPLPTPRKEPTIGGNVKEAFKGIIPGAAGLVETAGAGLAALLPDEVEKAARSKLHDIVKSVSDPFAPEAGYEDSIGRNIGQGLGSTVPFFLMGALGPAARLASVGVAGAAGAGEARQSAEAKGVTGDERGVATALGIAPGLIDVVAPELRVAGNFIKRALVKGGVEGATEAAQRVAQNLIAKGVYDPSQPILAGSGEEGAYGAGVGALASLLVDMAVGRRGRGGRGSTGEQTTIGEQPPPTGLSPDAKQGDLFPNELRTAETAAMPPAPPPAGTQGNLFTQEEAPIPEPQPTAPTPQEGQGDLFATPPAEETRTMQQRDMVDESEQAQIDDLMRQEKIAPVVEAKNEAEIQKVRDANTAKQEQDRLKFESDLAELDGRLKASEVKTTEEKRLALLLPIIDNAKVKNIPGVFKGELLRAGYPGTQFTEREQNLIQRAYDIRKAEEVPAETPPVIPSGSTAQTESQLQGQIKEKQAKVRQPEQLQLPGVPKPKVPAAVEEPAEVPTPLSQAQFDALGIAKTAPIRKRLEGKDFSVAADRDLIRQELQQYAGNPKVAAAARTKIQDLLGSNLFRTQGEMFGPKGGVLKPAVAKETKNVPTAKLEPTPTGTSTVSTGTGATSTGRTTAPRSTRVDGARDVAGRTDERKAEQPTALKEEKKESKPSKLTDKPINEFTYDDWVSLTGSIQGPARPNAANEDISTDDATLLRKMVIKIVKDGVAAGKTSKQIVDQVEALTKGGLRQNAIDNIYKLVESQKKESKPSKPKEAKPTLVESRRRTDKEGVSIEYRFGDDGFALVRVSNDGRASISNIQIGEEGSTKRGKGVGTKAYEEIGNALAAQGFTLESTRWSKDRSAISPAALRVWEKLTAAGLARQTGTETGKVADRFGTANEVREVPTYEFIPPAASKESKPSKPKEAKPTEKKEEKPKAAKSPIQEQATKNYMAAAKNDKAKAIDYLAADMYNASYPEKNEYKELRRISSDLLAGKMPSDMKFGKEGGHAAGTGGKFGKAFYESLSEADQATLIKRLEHYFVTTESKAKSTLEQINAQQRLVRANKETIEPPDGLDLVVSSELTRQLHPAAIDALRAGNVLEALRIISNQNLGRASTVAGNLAGVIGKTKVEFVKNLKNKSGKSVAGMYDPKTNTIYLSESTGLNVHTFLHEAVHAATSNTLANKSHPVTKQLTQLYNDVKGWLDTAYGATSLDEFVSEAMSNPEFQAKLQAINPKGDKITAWQRFVNTIGNFLRRMVGMDTKPLGSALDATDGLVISILAPAPNMRNAGVLYSMSATGNSSQVFKNLDASYLSAPSFQEGMDNLHEFFTGKVSNKLKDIVRSALPLHALVDVAKTYVPKAMMVDRLVAEKAGSEGLRNQSIEPILAKVETWASKNPDKLDAFNATVYDSTLAQVDPTKPRSEYKEVEDQKEWDAMQANLKAMGPEGAALYKTMRDTYKKLYDEIIRIVNARIDATSEDKDRAKAIKTEIYSRLVARGGLDPYFPLTREGDYWLSYHAKNPRTNTTELYVEAFDTERGRKRAIKEYEANGATNIQKFANLSSINYRNAPPTSFINGVLKTLEANKVKPEVTEEVMRFFLSTLPETSFAKAFQSRKGTLGFKQDAVRALRQKTISISRQLANMEYGAKLSQLREDIEKDFKAAGQPEDAKPYVDALNEHIQFAISPQIPKWSKIARSFGFNMTLGFNVSSAVVNAAQIPLIVAPYLGGKYGTVATTKALAHAMRIYTQSGFQRDVKTFVPIAGQEKTTVNAAPSLDNYDFDAKGTPEDVKRLKVLSDVAGRLGQLNRSQLYDVLDVTDPKGSVLDRVNAASGFVMHHGERMNRQVTMIAAYTLELDKMKAAGRKIDEAAMTEAAETAIYMTEMTNGGTSAAAAPRIAQSGLGAVMFMFKRYGASMYYLLFKSARDALRGADGQTRAAAMRQIAGIYGSAALFAGARGLPMFGMVAMMYNLFKDDDDEDLETSTRKFLGEGLYSGAINATTGLDISSRIGLSDLIFRDQKYSESTSAVASLMEVMGGPVFGVASRMERGLKLISEGHTERGIEAMLPSAIASVLKARRYATEGTTTLRGDPITGDVSAWNVFAQSFGFAPAEYTRQLEINSVEKGIDKDAGEKKTKLLRQFYVSTRFGDTPKAQEALTDLMALQKKHPGLKISADTILNSMQQHAKTSATMYHGIALSKGMRNELLQNAREFDEGYGDIDDINNPFGED